MSRDAARRYLIAYDVVDDRRRNRVATRLQAFGDRVQYSVFIVDARPAKLVRLRGVLLRIIDTDEDSVLVCDLGLLPADAGTRVEFLGRGRRVTSHGPLIL